MQMEMTMSSLPLGGIVCSLREPRLLQEKRFVSCRRSVSSSSTLFRLNKPTLAKISSRNFRSTGVTCKAKDLTEEEFDTVVLKSELPVLVDFWAEWCGPCKLVAPVVDWVSETYAGQIKVYKVDTDKSPSLVEKYKPYGLPTLVLFKDGEEVPGSRREGAITKAKLKTHLDELLPTVAA